MSEDILDNLDSDMDPLVDYSLDSDNSFPAGYFPASDNNYPAGYFLDSDYYIRYHSSLNFAVDDYQYFSHLLVILRFRLLSLIQKALP
jgi:hypothetical protein